MVSNLVGWRPFWDYAESSCPDLRRRFSLSLFNPIRVTDLPVCSYFRTLPQHPRGYISHKQVAHPLFSPCAVLLPTLANFCSNTICVRLHVHASSAVQFGVYGWLGSFKKKRTYPRSAHTHNGIKILIVWKRCCPYLDLPFVVPKQIVLAHWAGDITSFNLDFSRSLLSQLFSP